MRMLQVNLTGGREERTAWILPFGPLPDLILHGNKYYVLSNAETKTYTLVEGVALAFDEPQA